MGRARWEVQIKKPGDATEVSKRKGEQRQYMDTEYQAENNLEQPRVTSRLPNYDRTA
jgi:hypothetical protein